jgi:hypothetical protein
LHSQLKNTLQSLPEQSTPEEPAKPDPARLVAFGFRDDGTWGLNAVLPADEGAVVQKALERARDEVFNEHRDDPSGVVDWADGLVRVAETAIDAMDPAVARGAPRGSRFQIHVHVDARSDGDGGAHLHLGPALPDALRRYLICDATVRTVIESDGRRLLGISPAAPTVDHKTRMYIENRDGGCRFPGCGQRRWLHIHHIEHREDGGRTVACNLVCLCPYHHRLHHQGGFTIEGDPEAGTLVLRTKFGTELRAPEPDRPAELPPGAATATFTPPSGERLDGRWFAWN